MNLGARLRRRWYLVILAAIVGIAVAGASLVKISHKGIHESRTTYHVATGQILVDTDPSTLTNVTNSAGGLAGRATLIAEYSTGPAVIDQVARKVGLPATSISVQAQSANPTKTGGSASKDLTSGSAKKNSILLRTAGQGQTIGVSAEAHSKKKAKALVAAMITAMEHSLVKLQAAQPFNHAAASTTSSTTASTSTTTPAGTGTATGKGNGSGNGKKAAAALAAKRSRAAAATAAQKANRIQLSKIVLRPLGAINSYDIVSTPKKSTAAAYGIVAFVVLLLLILLLDNLLVGRRRAPVEAVPVGAGPVGRGPVDDPLEHGHVASGPVDDGRAEDGAPVDTAAYRTEG